MGNKQEDNQIFGLTEEQYLYLLSVVVIITAISLLGWFAWQFYVNSQLSTEEGKEKQKVTTKKTTSCKTRRVLDGVCIEGSDLKENPKLIGVMIENHVDARPQFGLSEARVVYEAPVEMNISRFLALYTQQQELGKVGPVRSARPYFIDWIREYGDAVYTHVGGSPSALDYIDSTSLNDLDEFSRRWYFWHSENRKRPHDTFISSDLWNKAQQDYSNLYKDKKYEGWSFEEVKSCTFTTSTDCYREIKVYFDRPHYTVTWKYNSSTQRYERYQAGSAHRDQDGDQITADTVIIQHVETKVVDKMGRLDMETTGKGKAEIFMEGQRIEGEWRKEDKKSRTKFYNEKGKEIILNPGKIWIEVANPRTFVNFQ